MKFPRTLLAAGLALSLGTVAMADDGVYPVDLAKKEPVVGEAFNKLFSSVEKDASWLKDYGTAQPIKEIKRGEHDAYVFKGCKPHACPDEQYIALISKDGKKAIGAWIQNEGKDGAAEAQSTKITWLGNPGPRIKAKLVKMAFWNGNKDGEEHKHNGDKKDWKAKKEEWKAKKAAEGKEGSAKPDPKNESKPKPAPKPAPESAPDNADD